MAEYNAGSIEASLELNRNPFEAGLSAAQSEAEAFEKKPIVVRVEAKADAASFVKAWETFKAVADVSPVTIAVKAKADLTSLAAAFGIMQAAVDRHPVTTPLRAVADIDSVLKAQAEMQAIVGHTIYDKLVAVPDDASVIAAEAAMQKEVRPIDVPVDAEANVHQIASVLRDMAAHFEMDTLPIKVVLDTATTRSEFQGLLSELVRSAAAHGPVTGNYVRDIGLNLNPMTEVLRTMLHKSIEQSASYTADYIANQFLKDVPQSLGQRRDIALHGVFGPIAEGAPIQAMKNALAQLTAQRVAEAGQGDTRLLQLGSLLGQPGFGEGITGMASQDALDRMNKAFDEAARIVAQKDIQATEQAATVALRTVQLDAEQGLKRLVRLTREELNDVAKQVGIKYPGSYETKKELAERILREGPIDIQTKVDANAASLIDAIMKYQAIADGDPIKLRTAINLTAGLESRSRDLLNLIAQGVGMTPQQAIAYKTRGDLVSAMLAGSGGNYPPPPPTPTAAGEEPAGPVTRALSSAAMAGVAAHALGLSLPHLILTGVSLVTSAIGAALGGGALALGSGGVLAVGMGSDIAVMRDTLSEISAIRQGGTAGAQALQSADVAGPALQQTANNLNAMSALWDKATAQAKIQAAHLLDQTILVANTYIPLIGAAAQRNFSIINQSIKPLFDWLKGPQGTGIFMNLENIFAKNLPYSVDAFNNALEVLLQTINHIATSDLSGFMQKVDHYFQQLNTPSGLDKLFKSVDHAVAVFRTWEGFAHQLFDVIMEIVHIDAGTGTSIIAELTNGLKSLDTWMHGSGGQLLHQYFESHKKLILDLIQAIGAFISQAGPSILGLLTQIANASAPLLPVIAEGLGLFARALADIGSVFARVPLLGNLAALLLVMKGFTALPWGIGGAFKLFLDPIIKLIALPLDPFLTKFGGLRRMLASLPLIGGMFGAKVSSETLAMQEAAGAMTDAAVAMQEAATAMQAGGAAMAEGAGAATEGAAAATAGASAATAEGGAAGLLARIRGGVVSRAVPLVGGALAGGYAGHYLAGATEPGKGTQAQVGRGLTTAGGAILGLSGAMATTGVGAIPAAITAAVGAAVTGAGEIVDHWKGVSQAFEQFFGKDIPKWTSGARSAFVQFFANDIPQWSTTAGGAFAQFFGKDIPQWFGTDLPNAVKGAAHWLSNTDNIKNAVKHMTAGALNWLKGGGSDAVHGFSNGMHAALPAVGHFFQELPGYIGRFTASATAWLLTTGEHVLLGMYHGLLRYGPTVFRFFAVTLPVSIVHAVAKAGTWLLQTGEQLLLGLLHGIERYGPEVFNFFTTTLPNTIIHAVVKADTWLLHTGGAIISGLWDGITTAFPSVGAFFSSVKGKVLGFFKDAGSWLLQIGKDILQGLINGLNSGWDKIASWATRIYNDTVGKVANLLKNASPSKEMFQQGSWAAEGYALGLDAGRAKFVAGASDRFAQATMPRVSTPAASTGSSTGGNQTHFHFDIKNPLPEKPSDTMHTSMQKIKFHGLMPEYLWSTK